MSLISLVDLQLNWQAGPLPQLYLYSPVLSILKLTPKFLLFSLLPASSWVVCLEAQALLNLLTAASQC